MRRERDPHRIPEYIVGAVTTLFVLAAIVANVHDAMVYPGGIVERLVTFTLRGVWSVFLASWVGALVGGLIAAPFYLWGEHKRSSALKRASESDGGRRSWGPNMRG